MTTNTETSREYIHLATINSKVKRKILMSFMVIIVTYAGTSLLLFGLSITTLFLLSLSTVFIFFFGKTYRSLSSAKIKGDTIILKNIDDHAAVTHIKSIRKIRTRHFGGKAFTSVNYKLDGINRSAILISDEKDVNTPQEMIQRAQQELKKKKANL